jgi:putative flippase GtrA
MQVARFVFVGGLAALTHLTVVVALVSAGIAAPLVANVAGFLVAFWVSYFGQRNWTFRAKNVRHRRGVPLHFAVATGSFLLNEGLFWLLLRFTPLPYPVALVIVLAAVAVVTFVLLRRWVFRSA